MLNLEEELKVPIVASPAGGEATRFVILREDVAYIYTLGKALIDDDESFDSMRKTLKQSGSGTRHRLG